MVDMVDSEDEDDGEEENEPYGGGIGEDEEFVKEIKFEQKSKKKVRFEKMAKVGNQKCRKESQKLSQGLEINLVEGGAGKGKSKITIDSGAEESVWPIGEVGDRELIETEASRNNVGFIAANGAKMKNFGALKVDFSNDGKPLSMKFHATNVKKPLAAVCRITQCGNRVCFGPRPEDNYIENVETNEKIQMKKERGTYVLEVDMNDSSVFPRRE